MIRHDNSSGSIVVSTMLTFVARPIWSHIYLMFSLYWNQFRIIALLLRFTWSLSQFLPYISLSVQTDEMNQNPVQHRATITTIPLAITTKTQQIFSYSSRNPTLITFMTHSHIHFWPILSPAEHLSHVASSCKTFDTGLENPQQTRCH